MPCPVCQHNQVKIIDRALLAGADPSSLSRTYGFSPAALRRHQEHLTHKMATAGPRFHANLHQGLFCKLTQVMEMVLFVVQEAKQGGDFKFFLQASREFTRLLSLMHKMAAKLNLDPEFIYCLMASPQWDLQEDSLLPSALQAMTENRQTLKINLFAPCPEPGPEMDHAPGLHLAPRQPAGAAAAREPESPEPSRLPLKTPLAHQARRQRDKSAKITPKNQALKKINEINQLDSLCEKNVPAKRENLFQKVFRRWEKSGKKVGNEREKIAFRW
jgi:hypothetical protein